MTMQGDDCYFYYYSTCTKGDSCPFRHCEAAMGSETVCTLWQEQRCFRNVCMFRHMEIKKNRKEIACYWENQPAGCQKPHCAFHHEKPRVIDGNYFAPDKGQVVRKEKEETPHEDQVPAPTTNPTNPQLRGVIRTETQENVPSPTHPPVVINPVDDDDEDDQFSEEGDESLVGSTRKMITSKNDSLNFGIQTLEEIRLRKALMASLKKSGQSAMQSSAQNKGAAIEKENIRSLSSLEVSNSGINSSVNEIGRRKIADRLGKRILARGAPVEEDLPLKRRLAESLGGIVESSTDMKAQKPVRERLGLTAAPSSADSEPKSSGDIRIKTLEEIRQEKAARNLNTSKVVRVVKEAPAKELSPSKKSVKPAGGPQVKTFSEILHEKKKMQEKKVQEVNKTARSPEGNEGPSTAGAAVKAPVAAGEVRVKTLEEIRREKAARMQEQLQETTDGKTPTSTEAESGGPPKRRILRRNKSSSAACPVGQTKPDAPDEKLEPATETNGNGKPTSETVKVKTFEEIMREKRLRKLQEEQVTSTNQKNTGLSAPAASPPASEPSAQPQTTVRQRIALKHKSSPLPAAQEVPQKSSPEHSRDRTPANTPKPSTSPVTPVQLAEETIQTETKVKPKVNVKPSVMKPAAQPTQKRKAAKIHSAVAEVKPLNTAGQTPSSLVIPNKHLKVESPTSPNVQSNAQQVPSNSVDIQMVPMNCVEPTSTTSSEIVAVPQSPVIKTPSMRSRRSSTTTGRTPAVTSSSVDDFEDLLDEFTDDRLEDDLELDSGKGEDDLLLELSEMIDS